MIEIEIDPRLHRHDRREQQKAGTQLYGSRTASPRQPCSSSTAAVRQPHRSSRAILESSSAAASQ